MKDAPGFVAPREGREVQSMVFASSSPSPQVQSRVTGPDYTVVEVAALLPDGAIRNTCNFYRMDDSGKIKSLNIYMRG